MDIGLYIVGILIAIISLLCLLVVTILSYLAYCSKHPMRKLRAEIFVVVLVCVISLAIRLGIGFASLPHNAIAGGVESVMHGILSTVAGLMFDSPAELSSFALVNGITVCFYYGLIAYTGFVFLSVVTVGVSYDFYSRIQTLLIRCRKRCTYYIFTSITHDSLVLAESIKKHEKDNKRPYVIIFFESGDESFSRKNPMHRKIMQNGFYYFSDPRCTDKGETICFLKKFKFKRKHCIKDDVGENHNKLFYIFALDDSGDYEGYNADVVFADLAATVKAYVYKKKKVAYNGIPTVLNYYVLTSGEVNYESYERRAEEVISEQIAKLPKEFDWCGSAKKPESLLDYIDSKTQINVINEATLSSHSLVLARNEHLRDLGDRAFDLTSAPDKNGAYRVAIIGFGKTGQYAMKELYIHTARLDKKSDAFIPTQFIADIYDDDIDKKSGLFAYNHPLFRCLDEKAKPVSKTSIVMGKAKNICGEGIEILCSEYKGQTGVGQTAAQDFIDSRMAFPVAVMHKGNCFGYPFLAAAGTETAIAAVRDYGIRDIVVALGNDERNIDMANILIDSFRRLFLKAELGNKKLELPHIKIYVNIIDKNNRAFIDWRWDKDEKLFTHPYKCDDKGKPTDCPWLSVIPFGFREQMYSYSTFIEDYRERLYNYGYNLLAAINDEKEDKGKQLKRQDYDRFKARVADDYNAYRTNEDAIDQWMTISQFLRLSNKSALMFSINYYKYKQLHINDFSEQDVEFLIRLEHERWSRFFISHGWVYAKYYKDNKYVQMSDEQKRTAKKEEKKARRKVRQHDCLCPFDVMLDDYTKAYDRGNVELGFIEEIALGKKLPLPADNKN